MTTTCAWCLSVSQCRKLSIELAYYLASGFTARQVVILIDELAEAHQCSVDLATLNAREQLEEFGAVHQAEVRSS